MEESREIQVTATLWYTGTGLEPLEPRDWFYPRDPALRPVRPWSSLRPRMSAVQAPLTWGTDPERCPVRTM
jgi:hypothetical protein